MKIAPLFLLMICCASIMSQEARFQVFIQLKSGPSFSEFLYVAGGAIIHPSIILTAANVFVTEDNNGRGIVNEYQHYRIVAGAQKISIWSRFGQPGLQNTNIKEINIPDEYLQDENKHDYNIALIEVDTPFEETATVRIMHIAREHDIAAVQTVDLSAWSNEQERKAIKIRVEINLCPADSDAESTITGERFCICDGDWSEVGAGIVFNDHVAGIGCNSGDQKLFIQPRKHLQFIDERIDEIEAKSDDTVTDKQKPKAEIYNVNAGNIFIIKC